MPPWCACGQQDAAVQPHSRIGLMLWSMRRVTRGWGGSLKLLGLRIAKAPTDNRKMHASSKVRPIANP